MNHNEEFLEQVYQSAQTSMDTIRQMTGITRDGEFRKMIANEYKRYNDVADEAEKNLRELNKNAEDPSLAARASMHVMAGINTPTHKSTTRLAQMLIDGSMRGVVNLTRSLREYKDAEPDYLELGQSLVKLEHEHIEELKKYL